MLFSPLVAFLLVVAEPTRVGADPSGIVLEGLQQARERAGAPVLNRRSDLDRAARLRAQEIARLPHPRRLSSGAVETLLRDAGITEFRAARERIDLRRGYGDLAGAVLSAWSEAEGSWVEAMSADWDAVGLATERAEDGWVVFVAVLLDEPKRKARDLDPRDLQQLELLVVDEINAVRRRKRKAGLATDPVLGKIARAHSEDMARRGYFDHRSPEGGRPRDRVGARGVSFSRLGENIHMSRGADDPVAVAVRGWIDSASHRRTLLDAEFTTTGVGVAVGADGAVYFTQLFMTPVPDDP